MDYSLKISEDFKNIENIIDSGNNTVSLNIQNTKSFIFNYYID